MARRKPSDRERRKNAPASVRPLIRRVRQVGAAEPIVSAEEKAADTRGQSRTTRSTFEQQE